MSPKPPQIPHWRHVYRGLLRESSYLPDPVARQYMSNYVRQSYRDYRPRVQTNSYTGPNGQFYVERRARKLLSILSRANEGYLKPLERVLMLSYGRLGRRRHALARPLFVPNSPEVPFRMILPYKLPRNWEPIPALSALIDSQAIRMGSRRDEMVGTPIIRKKPEPKGNIWNGYVSHRKVQIALRKWYDSIVKGILPPIPDQEWQTLYGLVTGTEPWELPKRRKRLAENTTNNALDAEFLVFGPEKGHTFGSYVRGRPHTITRKIMTPLWNRVLASTPRMRQDTETGKWKVSWGMPIVKAPSFRKMDSELAAAVSFFDCIDPKNGNMLQPQG
ncbi:hypothetical protein AJ79_08985 [Helicocarpus griseus UAMH5409]|uniref:LYR motif-containing protein Cup1-like N-terminal domain-containing protein n=1 Tax=Helicocarpus griseus UAMH5409 TaxID=1447875 RepID=A0A2B7WN80_9EURO|nr:hypothetical protein AJ79_08985 [Helicocarpus griseus UAMH5409]